MFPTIQYLPCYTCKEEFENYFHFHRKKEHPSNKVCRYFKKKACIFEADICWYRHETKAEELRNANISKLHCNECGLEFVEKVELRKHMKKKHAISVARCWNFKDGNCNLANESCWFLHEEESPQMEENVTLEEAQQEESVFREATEKTPPDQMGQLIKIIAQLTLKVENLEKMALSTK